MSQKPIGIFDSGIGGFTVLKQLKKYLPQEGYVFFGDTAHLPYGNKSAENVQYYSSEITSFLLQQKSKVVVIACNSAASVAYDYLKSKVADTIPVIDMVEPVIDFVINNNYEKIGVIGTELTIKSNIYPKKLLAKNPNLICISKATPLLVPMIEEKLHLDTISDTIISNYLTEELLNVDAIILACTHYPLIVNNIEKLLPKRIEIIDPAKIVAKVVQDIIVNKNLSAVSKWGKAKDVFYVSELTDTFEKNTNIFFGKEVALVEKNIWS